MIIFYFYVRNHKYHQEIHAFPLQNKNNYCHYLLAHKLKSIFCIVVKIKVQYKW